MCCSVQDFASSEEYTVLMELVNSVNEKDEQTRQKYCDHGVFKAMDPEVRSTHHVLASYM